MPNPYIRTRLDDTQIRAAESGDLIELLELYRHLNPTDEPLPDRETVERLWTGMLTQPGFCCIVATSAGLIVASCCIAIIPNLTRGGRPYALIENVVTHQDFRRRGFATAVLKEALSRAWKAGCYKAMLLTGSKRPETHRFYERCGFRSDEKTGFVARPSRS
jgi:GNAT superfamily N-acetyltransferase